MELDDTRSAKHGSVRPASYSHRDARSMIVRASALTTRDVVGGLLVAAAAGGVIDTLGTPLPILLRRTLSVATAIAVLFQAMKFWGRDMTRLAGQAGVGGISRAGALVLAILFGTIGLVLGVTEPFVVGRAALRGFQIHQVYMVLFVTATLLIATAGTFTLGRGLRGNSFASRLGLPSGIVAAAAFLAVALAMDAIGWRVGAPRAAERATMVVVTTLGLIAAGIAAGSVIGFMLSQTQREHR